jgi:hypothetical protein
MGLKVLANLCQDYFKFWFELFDGFTVTLELLVDRNYQVNMFIYSSVKHILNTDTTSYLVVMKVIM